MSNDNFFKMIEVLAYLSMISKNTIDIINTINFKKNKG